MGKIIYLSPSNQYNRTCIDKVTEKMLMEPIAKALLLELEKYDCTPVYPTVFDRNGSYTGRPAEAKNLGADIYVAIHSNSSGVAGAYAAGCVGYYHGSDELSKRLARSIQLRLDAACEIKSNRASSLVDGMQAFSGYGYGELREPKKLGITPVLIETNFHSYEPTCRYLYENPQKIGHEMALSIAETLGLKLKTSPTLPTQSEGEEKDGGNTAEGSQDTGPEERTFAVGDVVNFTGTSHYVSSYKNAASYPARPGRAIVTKIITNKTEDQIHTLHLIADDSGSSTVYGWVDPSDVELIKDSGQTEQIFETGDEVKFRKEAIVYYPGGSTIPDWVKQDYTHIITQTLAGGASVWKGGKLCVLLGKKKSVNGEKIIAGINTWVDISNLIKVNS